MAPDRHGLGGSILLEQIRRRAPSTVAERLSVDVAQAAGVGRVTVAGVAVLTFPLLSTRPTYNVFDSGAVGVTVDSASGMRIIPVPRIFVAPAAVGRRLHELRRHGADVLDCPIDLTGLLDWAYCGSGVPGDPPRNWSHYVAARSLGNLSLEPYVEDLLDAVAAAIFPDSGVPRKGALVITGDTDNATEDEILRFLDAVEAAGAECTLMVHREEHLTKRVVARLERRHEVGIHPYSESGTFADYEANVRRLAQACRQKAGRAPTALRSHRFQWMEPQRARTLIRSIGIESCVDFVCSNGTAWVGTPTGVAGPASLWTLHGWLQLLPTIVEDEVFLYDVDYSFRHAGSLWRSRPNFLLGAFLDNWVAHEDRPVCVNLHPEHACSGYDGVQQATLAWSVRSEFRGISLHQYRALTQGGMANDS